MSSRIYRWPILRTAVSKPISLVPTTTERLEIDIKVVNMVAEDLVQDRAMAKANMATVPIDKKWPDDQVGKLNPVGNRAKAQDQDSKNSAPD